MPGKPGENPSIHLLPTHLASVRQPAKTFLLVDMNDNWGSNGFGAIIGRISNPPIDGRHNEGDNWGFVDGHAKWYRTVGVLEPWDGGSPRLHIYPPGADCDTAAFWMPPFYPDCYPYSYGNYINTCG